LYKNILITGANGQDGTIIVKKLLKKKINLFLVAKKFRNKLLKKNIKYFKFNLNKKKQLENLFKKNRVDIVLHLASNNPNFGQNNYKKHYVENLLNTKTLIDFSVKYNKKIKFISCSSSRIFKKKKGIVDEKANVISRDFYSKFRIEINDYLSKIKKVNPNFDFTNVILFNHDSIFRSKRFIIPRIISAIINSNKKFLNKIIKQNIVMDFSHADDICNGLIKISLFKKKIDKIILSSNNKTYLNDIIKFILRKNHINLNLNFNNLRKRNYVIGNNLLAKKKLHWKIKKNIFIASQEIYNYKLRKNFN